MQSTFDGIEFQFVPETHVFFYNLPLFFGHRRHDGSETFFYMRAMDRQVFQIDLLRVGGV